MTGTSEGAGRAGATRRARRPGAAARRARAAAPHPPGRRERRKLATRRELIAAGRRLFSEKGLYESRIEDLSARAGIAKGTLYTYFADKDELIEAVVAGGFADLGAAVRARTRGARGVVPRVRRMVQAHLDFFAAHADLVRVFHQARGMLTFDRPRRSPLRTPLRAHLDTLAGLLAEEPPLAHAGARLRLEIARLVFGFVSGLTSVCMSLEPDRSRPPAADVLAHCLGDMVERYLAARRPGR